MLESLLKKNCDRDIENQAKKYTQVHVKGNTRLVYTLAQQWKTLTAMMMPLNQEDAGELRRWGAGEVRDANSSSSETGTAPS